MKATRDAQAKEYEAAVSSTGGQSVALHTSLLAAVAAPDEDALMEAAVRHRDVPAGFDAATAQDADEFSPVADPLTSELLFDLHACTQMSGFSLHGAPDDRSDAKAELIIPDSAMLVSPIARKYVREVTGPRYQWKHGRLRLVSRKFATSAQNQRHVLEQAQAVMVAAQDLEAEFGDFHQPRVKALPYGHRQRRTAKRRKGKAGLSF